MGAEVDGAGRVIGTLAVAANLELHAKTYYNNPLVQGGDEHYFSISYVPQLPGGPARHTALGWDTAVGNWVNKSTPLGGYLTVYGTARNCQHPNMHSAVLVMMTVLSYWGSFPTTWPSPDWEAVMTGTEYTVTRVTP